ncbi:HU domain-containing protein [Wenyingzhuangia sp. IMCC45533]
MQLSKYISDLLYRYECVMIPNFGGFVSNTIPSMINTNHQFTPPTKNISFNVNLQQNDGLLINHIAKSLHISFDTAANQVQEVVNQWKNDLETKSLSLDQIGRFSMENEQLVFEPINSINYLSSSFGLSNLDADFVLRNNIVAAKEVAAVVAEQKKSYGKYIAAAAIVIGGFLIGGNIYVNNLANQQEIAAQQEITQQIQQASFNILNPLPAITLKVEKEVVEEVTEIIEEEITYKYHIIAGAFKEADNAVKKVNMLTNKGYDAKIMGLNKWGLTQVSYASFNDKREAINKLNAIRKKDNKHAWLYINE